MEITRPEQLNGRTYKIKAPNGNGDQINLYVTINDDADGRPLEIFLNCSDAALYEWLSLAMVLTSRLLRYGIPVTQIVDDMAAIHSARTGHFLSGGGFCPSLAARIGRVLGQHQARRQATLDLHTSNTTEGRPEQA